MQKYIHTIQNETQRVFKGVMPTSSYIGSQQMDEFENNQFQKGYDMQGLFNIHLKENF